jgi:hypothetical protein
MAQPTKNPAGAGFSVNEVRPVRGGKDIADIELKRAQT